MTTEKKQTHYNKTYKLIAQTGGLIVCLVCLFYIVGTLIPEIIKGSENNSFLLIMLAMLLIPQIGFVFTWYQEKAGATVLIAGACFLIIWGFIVSEYSIGIGFGLPFGIIGALFLYHLKKRNELKSKK